MDLLRSIDPSDLQTLMECEPAEVLGRIVELNRTERYRNGLNALLLAGMVIEMKATAEGRYQAISDRKQASGPLRPLVLPLRQDR